MSLHEKIPPKLAVINDIAGYGCCSTTVAIPVISVLKVQPCLVPTSIFSNHTGYPIFHFDDYTSQIPSYLDAWAKLGFSFDGIYSGFLGSVEQVQLVKEFILTQDDSPLVIVDPVMGDHGKTYRTITPEHCLAMSELVSLAEIITPNLTEACLLTNTAYPENDVNDSFLLSLSQKLHSLGPLQIVITGIKQGDNLGNYISIQKDREQLHTLCLGPIGGQSRHGTGDLFASIIAADALHQIPLEASVQKAAEFIRVCTKASDDANVPEPEGVIFENFLELLIK